MATSLNVPCIQPFESELSDSDASLGPKWDKWLLRFENYLSAIAVNDEGQKRALLLHAVGSTIFDIFVNLPNRGTTYEQAKTALTAYFKPKVNREYERAVFRRMRQESGEKIDAYHTRLRQAAASCEFNDINGEIKSHVIQTTTDSKLRKQGLTNDALTLGDIIEAGRNNELAQAQSLDIEKDLTGIQQDAKTIGRTFGQSKRRKPQHGVTKCRYCGKGFPHVGGKETCPAFGKQCFVCYGRNHFANFCPKKGQTNTTNKQFVKKSVRAVSDKVEDYVFTVGTVTDESTESDGCENSINDVSANTEGDVCESSIHGVYNSTFVAKPPKFKIEFEKCSVMMTADSGASCSLIDESTFQNKFKSVRLETCHDKLNAYGGTRIVTIGKFHSTIVCGKKTASDVFYVVKGNCGCLLSVNVSQKLGLIQVADHVVHNVGNTECPEVKKYPKVFEGIGRLKNFEVKLHINEAIPPVAQRHRRIPFHERQKVTKELLELKRNDVIERVEGPTPWVSPIVVVPKPKRPGEVRICVDMRQANKAIMRERHPSPTVDDIVQKLNNARVFSKIDLRSGYHQLMLAEESRYITTFSTHDGLWRYKRLNFGISSASEVFQNVVENVIEGIDGSFNMSDDIFVFGKGKTDEEAYAEHDKSLDQVLKRLDENGLTANLAKCEFRKPKMEFYGMMFSKNGIEPDPKKVEALLEMEPPVDVGEVQSLLGMTNYLARFIPNYSTVTAPLRKLTCKKQEFKWELEQQSSFEMLKGVLGTYPIVAYFDMKKETEIIVDASPVGLGAMLVQYQDKKPQVVAYGSRALTPVEQRYKSQLEREALAVVWACEYFHVYVYGAPVKVVTDHKPLVTLYGNPGAKLPLRLERWAMRLLPYQPVIEYRQGKDNPSDYLSRHPQVSDRSSREELVAEEYVNFVTEESIPKAMSSTEVLEATLADPTLSAVKDLLLTGKWYMLETKYGQDPGVDFEAMQSYSRVGNELTVTRDGLVLRGTRIAVPASLQHRVIHLAHEGHQGINKTKALLREKVWFPRIDAMVAKLLDECVACKAAYDPKPREPLVMSDLPSRKWSHLSADFYGPLPTGDYLLVVMDEYSRFPEVEVIKSLSAQTVIPVFEKIFSSRGTPDNLKTDNGTPFQSEEFKRFAVNLGFLHQRVTPYWPEANGVAERFMRTIGKVCKCAQVEGKPWKRELYRFLRNYRATPHTSTGLPPATVLNGVPLKMKLPQVHAEEMDETLRQKDWAAKNKMKEYAEARRKITKSDIGIGDKVLLKNVAQQGKLVPKFQHEPFEVIDRKGTMVTAQRGQEVKARNTSHFRRVSTDIEPLQYRPVEPDPAPTVVPPIVPVSHPVGSPYSTEASTSLSPSVHAPPSRPPRVKSVPKRFEGFRVNLPSFCKQ